MIRADAVVFDWSGVISDDINYVNDIVNRVLRSYGKTGLGLEEYRKIFSLNFAEFWRKLDVHDDIEKIQNIFNVVIDVGEPKPRIVENAYSVIEHFRSKGKKLAVFSAHPNVKKEIVGYGIEKFFDVVYAPVNKRSAESYCSALGCLLRELGVSASDAVLVEDMSEGIVAGRLAGIRTVALAHPDYGYHSFEALERESPDFIIREIKKLEEIIS